MIDLNAFRIFEAVAKHRSFSAAAKALGLPKSSVSRAIAALESELGTRLLQRTTREVVLTEAGSALELRCSDILTRVDDAVNHLVGLGASPRGLLKITAGIGFGHHVLGQVIPQFLDRYPLVQVALDLTSQNIDLVASNVDVAVRMGPLPDSQLVATRLGSIPRVLCCSPSYIARRGLPKSADELCNHDIIEMPGANGRPRAWTLMDIAGEPVKIEFRPRATVNDTMTMHRFTLQGAGVACLPKYMSTDDLQTGRLIELLPNLRPVAVEVSVVFPSSRELAPTVRAFVDFLRSSTASNSLWETGK